MKVCLILVFALAACVLAEEYDIESMKDQDGWRCGKTTDNDGNLVYTSSKYVERDGKVIFTQLLGCLDTRREGTPAGSDFKDGGSGGIRWHTCSDASGICTGEIWEKDA